MLLYEEDVIVPEETVPFYDREGHLIKGILIDPFVDDDGMVEYYFRGPNIDSFEASIPLEIALDDEALQDYFWPVGDRKEDDDAARQVLHIQNDDHKRPLDLGAYEDD